MANSIKQDIELGITNAEGRRGLLEIQTGKGFRGGVRSSVTVFWSDGQFKSTALLQDFNKNVLVTPGVCTQKKVDTQHAAVFTAEGIAALVAEAKGQYVGVMVCGNCEHHFKGKPGDACPRCECTDLETKADYGRLVSARAATTSFERVPISDETAYHVPATHKPGNDPACPGCVEGLSGSEAVVIMENWLKALVPADGSHRTFGNVEVWINLEGPWAGQLSYSRPTTEWDRKTFNADVVAALKSERDLF